MLSFRQVVINLVFTAAIVFGFLLLMFESKMYFGKKAKLWQNDGLLASDVGDYRIKNHELVDLENTNDTTPLPHYYSKNSIIKIHALDSADETGKDSLPERLLQDEFISDILNNPLFRGYYVQLGIFPEKSAAYDSIQTLFNQLAINSSFTTYVETKYIQEKPFYLAQVGVFSSKEDALSFCEKIQKLSFGCLLVE